MISIGGFTGSDPAPTLAQFQRYVAIGEISYFVAGGGFGGGAGFGGGSSAASEIQAGSSRTSPRPRSAGPRSTR